MLIKNNKIKKKFYIKHMHKIKRENIRIYWLEQNKYDSGLGTQYLILRGSFNVFIKA